MTVAEFVSTQVLDVPELLGRCLGQRELAHRVLSRFGQQLADDLQALREAVKSGDAEQLTRLAHRMKGAAANVAAHNLREQAAAVEAAGRTGDWVEIVTALDQLTVEREQFDAALQQLEWNAGA
jgi:HPt (histidine-containing phosphotransfer) domain-containing protein